LQSPSGFLSFKLPSLLLYLASQEDHVDRVSYFFYSFYHALTDYTHSISARQYPSSTHYPDPPSITPSTAEESIFENALL